MPEVNQLSVVVEADASELDMALGRAVDRIKDAIGRMVGARTGGSLRIQVTPQEAEKLRPRLMAIKAPVEAALAAAVDETTAKVVEGARERVPVDTGRLRYSIRATDASRAGGKAKGTVTAGGDAKRSRWISSKTGKEVRGNVVAYAAAVELGHPTQPAYPRQPFMFPAAEAERNPYRDRAKEKVTQAVKEALR